MSLIKHTACIHQGNINQHVHSGLTTKHALLFEPICRQTACFLFVLSSAELDFPTLFSTLLSSERKEGFISDALGCQKRGTYWLARLSFIFASIHHIKESMRNRLCYVATDMSTNRREGCVKAARTRKHET